MKNNNAKLPKLTADIFNRPECPKWVKWATVDATGHVWAFASKPCLVSNWVSNSDAYFLCSGYNAVDWQNSLIERPAVKNCDKQETEIKNTTVNDDVKHPNHYTDTPFGLEVIEITKHYDFCTGNALKYIFRHGKKVYDGLTIKDSAIKDLRKAIQNLEFKIKFIEEEWDDKGTCKPSKEVICPECGRATSSIWSKDGGLNGMVTCLSCGYTFDPIFERYQNTGNTIL